MADRVLQQRPPMAMIICPCEGRHSHNEAKAIIVERATAGCNVLLGALLAAADVVSD